MSDENMLTGVVVQNEVEPPVVDEEHVEGITLGVDVAVTQDRLAQLGSDSTATAALIQVVNAEGRDGNVSPENQVKFDEVVNDHTKIDMHNVGPLIQEVYKGINFKRSASRGIYARSFIRIGKVLLGAQMKASQEYIDWSEWLKDNIEVFMEKNCQVAIYLAKVKNIEEYFYIGKEGLLNIAQATSKWGAEDPIGAFLEKYDIPLNPDTDQEESEYVAEIKKAIKHHKFRKQLAAKKMSTDVSFEIFKQAIRNKVKFNDNLIQELKLALDNGQSINGYLRTLKSEGGEYAPKATGIKKVGSVDNGMKDLEKTVKWVENNFDQVKDSINEGWLAKIDGIKGKLSSLLERKKANEPANQPE